MKILKSIFEISDKFDGLILDIWGVIHDGRELYPGVVDTLNKFHQHNKKIVMLSNAPRRSSVVIKKLDDLGVPRKAYDYAITSGEVMFEFVKNHKEWKNSPYYYIGPEKDSDLLHELGTKAVSNAKDAKFAFVTGYDDDDSPEDEKIEQLKEIKRYNLPLLCANPDMVIVRRNGMEALCSGVIAKQYEDMGGKVYYYGKPYSPAYEKCFSLLNMPKQRILAVGDNPDTDIKGARNMGIYPVLVTGGILGHAPNNEEIKNLLADKYNNITADAYIDCFR